MDLDEAATELGVITQHVGYSIGMIGSLPRYAGSEAVELGEVGSACLESFYIHIRLLSDFFLPPAKKRYLTDRNVSDLSATWQYPADDVRTRLAGVRDIPNQQVAHITAARFTSEVEDTSTARLVGLARDVLQVVRHFCSECKDADPGKVSFISYAVDAAELRLP